jgi:Na+/pantothenate symporter
VDQTVFVAQQNSDTTVTSGNPRTIHSVAADAANKQIILPIPAFGGNAPQFMPSLCDKTGVGITVIGSPSTTVGCIAVLAAPLNNDQ